MKILIVGIVASGKTTLARKLSKLLGICHYEIDSVVHDDINKIKRSEVEQRRIINDINVICQLIDNIIIKIPIAVTIEVISCVAL